MQAVEQFIESNALFSKRDKILVATSGGMDSMALLHFLHASGYLVSAAHCNFGLRGNESDLDEQLVKDYCQQHNIHLYTTSFPTAEIAKKQGVSIQMAARSLRYKYFEQCQKEDGLDFILTAHHANDNVETLLLNLTKTTGIRGQSGISVKNGKIRRPFLGISKKDIIRYVDHQNILYREDESNAKDDYQRNLIRNKVIPILEQINPDLIHSLAESIEQSSWAKDLLNKQIQKSKRTLLTHMPYGSKISIARILSAQYPKTLLFELLRDFGFQSNQIQDILNSSHGQSGLVFNSKSHQLVKDRKHFIISPLGDKQVFSVLETPTSVHIGNSNIKTELTELTSLADIDKNPNKAYLDWTKIDKPLIVRYVQDGDYFYPLGLNKKKKVNRFLTDLKVSRSEKQQTLVVCHGEHIIYVVGFRIDHRYRITDCKQTALLLTFRQH